MADSTTTYAKLIWMGEHSVVYGHPAIALPLKTARVVSTCEDAQIDQIQSAFYTGPLSEADDRLQPLCLLISALRNALKLSPKRLIIQSDLPIGAGLGASAALAGSIVKAMHQAAGVKYTTETLRAWIQVSETAAHGRASGVDAATVTSETPIEFIKGSTPQPLDTPIPGFLFVADSGVFGSTKEAVAIVAKARETKEGLKRVEALGNLAATFLQELKQGRFESIGTRMNEAQRHLASLGVSHPKLDWMIDLALHHGATGAKLTGGGLGGCMIAYAPTFESIVTVRQAFLEQGYESIWVLDLEKAFSDVKAVTSRAPINIALIKYWGKQDEREVLPTAPSLSLSLSRYETITRIARSNETGIMFRLNGKEEEPMLPRVKAFLKQFTKGEEPTHLCIESVNTGPTAAGLASSASAFAALAIAANAYFGTHFALDRLAAITRKGSGSAVRSLLPGAVAWKEDGSIEEWDLPFDDLQMGILIVNDARKSIGSTQAMKQTMLTSPMYDSWVRQTRNQFEAIEVALSQGDFESVGSLTEQNALALHHLCETAKPPIVYLTKTSKAIIASLQEERSKGSFLAYATMDAGPNVKILCRQRDQAVIEAWANKHQFPPVIWSMIDRKGAVILDE